MTTQICRQDRAYEKAVQHKLEDNTRLYKCVDETNVQTIQHKCR